MAVGKMAAGKCGAVHNVEKTQQIVPLTAHETAFSLKVCELVLGFNVLYLDLPIRSSSVKQPIKRNSVGAEYVSHPRASAFDDHLYHSFVIIENKQL